MFEHGNAGTNTTMLVQPSGFGGYNNGGGFFGGDWAWIILLLLIGGGGWGMGGFGMGGMMWPMMMGGMGAGFGLDYLYPWLNNSQHISDGFRDQNMNNQISDARTDINRGFGDVQLGQAAINQNICQTGNGITQAINNGFSGAEIAANNRQMSNMQQMFGLQSQLAQCCCDNKSAALENRYVLAQEACATRTADAQNTRDVIDAVNRGNQSILDKLCALELDGVKGQLAQAQRENVGLQNQLNMAALRESQTAQNAFIQQGFSNEVDALYNRLNSCPVPTTPVYGRTPIFTCNNQPNYNGCGCGCGA
jgi:hypothetical protein